MPCHALSQMNTPRGSDADVSLTYTRKTPGGKKWRPSPDLQQERGSIAWTTLDALAAAGFSWSDCEPGSLITSGRPKRVTVAENNCTQRGGGLMCTGEIGHKSLLWSTLLHRRGNDEQGRARTVLTNTLWTESPLKRWREEGEKEPEPRIDPDLPDLDHVHYKYVSVTQQAENPAQERCSSNQKGSESGGLGFRDGCRGKFINLPG